MRVKDMSNNYHSRIRKIDKIGKGTYFTRNYSVGLYFIKTIVDFFISIVLFILVLPIKIIIIPFKIIKTLFNKK